MKSIRISILAGIVFALLLVAGLIAFDRMKAEHALEALQHTLNEVSLPILRQGDTRELQEHETEGAVQVIPSFAVYDSMLPLIALDPWKGEITPPSLLSFKRAEAKVSARANFSRGVSDIYASLIYQEGEWRIQRYEIIRGPLAQ